MGNQGSAEETIRTIKRKTRREYSGEEKIRIVVEELRGEESIAALCRREGISESLYYKWSKESLEAGKARLIGDTKRQASSREVEELRQQNDQLKQLVAELALKNRVLKKKLAWHGRRVGRVMRCSQAARSEIIRLVEESELPVKQTLEELDVPRSTFYRWYRRYQEAGYDGLPIGSPIRASSRTGSPMRCVTTSYR